MDSGCARSTADERFGASLSVVTVWVRKGVLAHGWTWLCGLQLMLRAAIGDCLTFDVFPFEADTLSVSKIDVSRREIAQALVIADMVVMLDEGRDLTFEIAGSPRWFPSISLGRRTRRPISTTCLQAHLCFDLFEGPGQEVGAAHPCLEHAERMLDGLPTDWPPAYRRAWFASCRARSRRLRRGAAVCGDAEGCTTAAQIPSRARETKSWFV
jgi:hypothetical protein